VTGKDEMLKHDVARGGSMDGGAFSMELETGACI
jgi:hypothetical protein